jgi:hypothetical protein
LLDDQALVHDDDPVGDRAGKVIPWVRTSMVMSSMASLRMTANTSPTNSGSSAEIGSLNSLSSAQRLPLVSSCAVSFSSSTTASSCFGRAFSAASSFKLLVPSACRMSA